MSLLLERATSTDVVDGIVNTFLERPPAWAEAQLRYGELEVHELGRCVWNVPRRRIERALERMASVESLRNLEPDAPSRRNVRRMRRRLAPESLITPHLANVVVQVAIFGELEYS